MISRKNVLTLGLVVLTSFVTYLGWSYLTSGFGFPLDDAWIHQTYARNFGEKYQWSFLIDAPSGGSTGPLWGMLIALLYLLKIPSLWGTYFIGFLVLWGTAIAGSVLFDKISPQNGSYTLIAGGLIAVEWHLVWSALSGMETILLILLALIFFCWLIDRKENWWLPGILIGISTWVRPDGLTLLGPALMSLTLRSYPIKKVLKKALAFAAGALLIFGPYILFNWLVSGDVWPNTFYAKQAEYEVLRQTGMPNRYLKVGLQFITGVGVLLLPGMVVEMKDQIQSKNWEAVAVFIWMAGYIGLYAWRLPVTYQHGRYIIPAMPVGFLFGLSGLIKWTDMQAEKLWRRVVSGAWIVSGIIVTVSFWVYGARAYALDVAVIETEMVRTARWIEENTQENALIAAHDIGALGYFSERKILDLAGLITPDVIPFIRNEGKLAEYLDQEKADYLVTFPSWYSDLTDGLIPVYQSEGEFTPGFGMDNMTVFEWK
jgi:hypothetical protein